MCPWKKNVAATTSGNLMSEVVHFTWKRTCTFFRPNVAPALCSFKNTRPTCSLCSSVVREKKMMSYKYDNATLHFTGDNMTSKVCCKVAGALQRTNGM